MIRYSSYSATNFRPISELTYLDPLEVQYRELLELRDRVRKAEAAAERGRIWPPPRTWRDHGIPNRWSEKVAAFTRMPSRLSRSGG